MKERYLRITQIGSSIGKNKKAKRTLVALGLGKIGKSRVHKDSPSLRGMLEVVKYLVKVEEVEDVDTLKYRS